MKLDTKEQATTALNLLNHDTMKKLGVNIIEVFEIGGRYFIGNYNIAVMNYAKNNPEGGDFFVWLQDNWKQIN